MELNEWEEVDYSTPECWYVEIKTHRGKIGIAKLYISYSMNCEDHYEWMCPKDSIIPDPVNEWRCLENQYRINREDLEDFKKNYKCEMQCSIGCGALE